MASVYRAQIGLYDLPCRTKRICEMNAVDQLRKVDWLCNSNSAGKVGSCSATPTKATCLEKPDNLEYKTPTKDDLSSSMYKLLHLNNESCKKADASSSALCAWPVCSSAKQHKGGYLADNLSSIERSQDVSSSISTKDRSSSAKEPQTSSQLRSELLKEPRSKSEASSLLEMRSGNSASRSWIPSDSVSPQNLYRFTRTCGNLRQESPHSSYKFYHFKNPSEHIRFYRENITNASVSNHIKKRILQTTTKKSTTTETRREQCQKERHCKASRSNFTFFRLNVSKAAFSVSGSGNTGEADNGILRVGPCPGVRKAQPVTNKKRPKEIKAVLAKDEKKKQNTRCTKVHSSPKTCRNEKKKVEIPQTLCEIVSPQNVLPRTQKPKILQNRDCGKKRVNLVKQAENGVRVQLVFFETEPSLEKMKRKFLHCKTKTHTRVYHSVNYEKNYNGPNRSVRDKPNLEDKEFLRITTPLGQCKANSNSPVSEPTTPGPATPHPTSVNRDDRAASTSKDTARRSKLLCDLLSLQREPQAVFPKNSNFQACITPMSYAKSTISEELKQQKDRMPTQETNNVDVQLSRHSVEQCMSKERIERVVSRPSIPKVGPFISG